MSEGLQELVSSALDNAVDNRFEFDKWTFIEVAEDLVTCDSDLEIYPVSEIIPCVKEWYRNSQVLFKIID